MTESNLAREIASVLNRASRENKSNTPDFILATFLMDCLEAFESASNRREGWYDCRHEAGKPNMREALAFAQSVIKSGEPWTDTCERIIGGALGSKTLA